MDGIRGQRLHFMGIGGVGQSALARWAQRRGAIVDGCDREENDVVRELREEGIPVAVGHAPIHLEGADFVICTSAVPPEHPERRAAGERLLSRGAFLAKALSAYTALGVCGTHGKTTTTMLAAHLLIENGRDPTVILGGHAPALGGNLRLGESDLAVAELDESDGTFLEPKLAVAVITNVDADHLDRYGDADAYFEAFRRFAGQVSETGTLVTGIDCPRAKRLAREHRGWCMTYGLDEDADIRATAVKPHGRVQRFTLEVGGQERGDFWLSLPGLHNLQNALGAIAAARASGLKVAETSYHALGRAMTVARRCEWVGTRGGTTLYSDYAHHPTEIAATLGALRSLKPKRLLAVFQPHLFSRTKAFAAEFAEALKAADEIALVDVYPAREEPLPGVTSELVAAPLRAAGKTVHGPCALRPLRKRLEPLLAGFDMVVVLGAGDVDALARKWVDES